LYAEKKAFLLKGVNKENNRVCQGRDKQLGVQMAMTKVGSGRRKEWKGRVREAQGKQLTGKRQVIQSVLVL